MNVRTSCVIAAVCVLSACGGGDKNGTTFFSTPDKDGEFNNDFENNISGGGLVNRTTGSGFAYEFGSNGRDGFRATAGVLPTTEFGQAPTSGSITYVGQYELIEVTDISKDDTAFRATGPFFRRDSIVLNGNFNNGTLTGRSGKLAINGQIDGNKLGGSATYDGIEGPLQGGIDANQTVGAFHGNTGSRLFAGGFIAEK